MDEHVIANATLAEVLGKNDEDNDDLIAAKIVAMAVLGFGSFFCGVLPMKLTKMMGPAAAKTGDNNLLISLLLCFGGGVLLFTTFIHLQPEVREGFAALEAKEIVPTLGSGISLSELVFCFGFFFVYLVEEMVHLVLDKKLDDDALHRSLSVRCGNNAVAAAAATAEKAENVCIPRVTLNKLEDGYITASDKELYNSQSTVSTIAAGDELNHGRGHHHHHLDASIKNSFGGLLAVLALSFHAVFEGLAVGLEGGVQKVWYLFAAIATHKLVIAFCVGVELVSTKTKVLFVVVYIATFALVTPLGIGAGIALSETGKSNEDVTSLVLQGMAAGTLLYVVFFEVLARERNNQHSGIWQLFAILAGFAVMFSLQLFTGHDHNHGHDNVHLQHNHH